MVRTIDVEEILTQSFFSASSSPISPVLTSRLLLPALKREKAVVREEMCGLV